MRSATGSGLLVLSLAVAAAACGGATNPGDPCTLRPGVITPDSVALAPGDTATLRVSLLVPRSCLLDSSPLEYHWASGDSTVAAVSALDSIDALLAAVAPGTTVVEVTTSQTHTSIASARAIVRP